MSNDRALFSRRAALHAPLVMPWLAAAAPAAHAAAPAALDLSTPRAQLLAYMKLFVSLRSETVWYWFSGHMDINSARYGLKRVCDIESLCRRDVVVQADGSFKIMGWEGHYYHRAGDPEPLNEMSNPATGRTIRPWHHLEGPFTTTLSEAVRRPGGATEGTKPFAMPWTVCGPAIWTERDSIGEFPNPMDPKRWPLESAGPVLRLSETAVHYGLVADLANPKVLNAPSFFHYTGVYDWEPWFQMGQDPGFTTWKSAGRKLEALEELPAGILAAFRRVHPVLFTADLWTERQFPPEAYMVGREPAK